jgi:hypothetical protein
VAKVINLFLFCKCFLQLFSKNFSKKFILVVFVLILRWIYAVIMH